MEELKLRLESEERVKIEKLRIESAERIRMEDLKNQKEIRALELANMVDIEDKKTKLLQKKHDDLLIIKQQELAIRKSELAKQAEMDLKLADRQSAAVASFSSTLAAALRPPSKSTKGPGSLFEATSTAAVPAVSTSGPSPASQSTNAATSAKEPLDAKADVEKESRQLFAPRRKKTAAVAANNPADAQPGLTGKRKAAGADDSEAKTGVLSKKAVTLKEKDKLWFVNIVVLDALKPGTVKEGMSVSTKVLDKYINAGSRQVTFDADVSAQFGSIQEQTVGDLKALVNNLQSDEWTPFDIFPPITLKNMAVATVGGRNLTFHTNDKMSLPALRKLLKDKSKRHTLFVCAMDEIFGATKLEDPKKRDKLPALIKRLGRSTSIRDWPHAMLFDAGVYTVRGVLAAYEVKGNFIPPPHPADVDPELGPNESIACGYHVIYADEDMETVKDKITKVVGYLNKYYGGPDLEVILPPSDCPTDAITMPAICASGPLDVIRNDHPAMFRYLYFEWYLQDSEEYRAAFAQTPNAAKPVIPDDIYAIMVQFGSVKPKKAEPLEAQPEQPEAG